MTDKQDNPEERAHARKSASGSKTWLSCSGSIVMAELYPEGDRSREAADRGTAAHSLGEACIRNGFEHPSVYEGCWVTMDGEIHPDEPNAYAFEVDYEMIDGVAVYVEAVREETERLDGAEMHVERRLDLSWLRPEMFGTNDCSVSSFMDELTILDYKNGRIFVSEVDNSQLKYYGVGVAHDEGFLHHTVNFVVVQPNGERGAPVRRWSCSMDELKRWAEEELGPGADRVDEACELVRGMSPKDAGRTLHEAGHLNATEEGCMWCPAQTECPAARARVFDTALADFDDEPDDVPVPQDLTELAKAMRWVPYIDAWCRGVMEHGQRAAEAGQTVPGFKLVQGGQAKRVWDPEVEENTIVAVMERLGVGADDLYTEPQLVTGPAAENLIKGKGAGKRKEEMNDLLLRKTVSDKVTLVPESDNREAIRPTAQSDFEEVDD